MVDRLSMEGLEPAQIVRTLAAQLRPNRPKFRGQTRPFLERMLGRKTDQFRPLQLRNLLPFSKRFGHWLPTQLGQLACCQTYRYDSFHQPCIAKSLALLWEQSEAAEELPMSCRASRSCTRIAA